ncbi:cytochrome P450 [Thozetella sp. PMI_491]|nr:cytochrome P450 [Thozetella sp. PMI_491]
MSILTGDGDTLNIQHLAGWLVTTLIAWYISSALRAWYRLRHIPGPRLASFSHLWIAVHTFRGNNHKAYMGLRKYGPLVRNGPNYLVTDDPDVLRTISGARSKYVRDPWYHVKFDPDRDTMASTLDTVVHDAIKAKVASGYSGRENPDLEAAVDSQVSRLVGLIRRKHLSTNDRLRRVDFCSFARFFTLDVITRLGYGKAFGYLDEGIDIYGWIAQIDGALALMSLAMDVPAIRRVVFSSFMLKLFGPKTWDQKGVGKMMGVTRRLIAERFQNDAKPREDMFGGFIRRGLSREELEGESMLQLLAGSDASAAAIRGTMLHILATPRVYGRLKAEIKSTAEQTGGSSIITYSQALNQPYLQAVIWEGYRIKCPVNYGHYKIVPPEGDTILGHFVPGGTAIGHNTAALTRKESIFGADADVFRPERFLECSEEKRLEMDRALDITFGGGRWMCAGKSIAMMELSKVLFELLRAFEFQLIDPAAPWKEKVYLIASQKDMWVRITEAN